MQLTSLSVRIAPEAFSANRSDRVRPKPAEPERPGVQEIAPRQPIAEMDGLVRVQLDH